MPDWAITVVVGLIAAGPGVYAIVVGRHKVKAEASKILSDTAVGLLRPLQERIDRLEVLILRLEAKVAALEADNEELSRQVREFRDLIRSLWEGVAILTRQLQTRGIPAAWNIEQYRAVVEKALGDTRE